MGSINLSAEQEAAFIRELAARALETITAEGSQVLLSLIVLPLATVTQFTGLSRTTIPQKMAVTKTCSGHHGVRLDVVLAYLDSVTVPPKGK